MMRQGMTYGLKDARAVIADAGRRQHAQTACQHGGLIRQNVSKDVASHDGVKDLGISEKLHSSIVNVPAALQGLQGA